MGGDHKSEPSEKRGWIQRLLGHKTRGDDVNKTARYPLLWSKRDAHADDIPYTAPVYASPEYYEQNRQRSKRLEQAERKKFTPSHETADDGSATDSSWFEPDAHTFEPPVDALVYASPEFFGWTRHSSQSEQPESEPRPEPNRNDSENAFSWLESNPYFVDLPVDAEVYASPEYFEWRQWKSEQAEKAAGESLTAEQADAQGTARYPSSWFEPDMHTGQIPAEGDVDTSPRFDQTAARSMEDDVPSHASTEKDIQP